MPVDDDELALMLKNAHTKLNDTNTTLSKLRKFIGGCKEIIKVPTEGSPQIKEIGEDRLLGTKMAASRRQAAYNKLLQDKITLDL